MNRAEATLAAIAGKRVELSDTHGRVRELGWDHRGLLVKDNANDWTIEDGSCYREGATYREVWQPRVFLGVWEEVRTFEEAEPAGTSSGCAMAFFALVEPNGDVYLEAGGSDNCEEAGGYWVRRKPDAASERVRLLEGLLDEALNHCSSYTADGIRRRMDAK